MRRARRRRALTTAIRAGVASCLAACTHAQSAAPAAAEAQPTVRFVGRFDLSDAEHPRFAWPASAIQTRFVGRGIHVHLKETGFDELEVVLDGEPAGVVATLPGRTDYEVATGLRDGAHELTLVKRTEARMGELQFLGFGPAVLAPLSPPPSRRVELIGDSITAGYGSEGAGPVCAGNLVAAENEYLSYGSIASRAVGAEHVTIAWSGRTVEEMGSLWNRTLPTHADSRWDFTRWTPDVVVVNLGTNDFNRGDPGKDAFVRPYVALLTKLRATYPRAAIICALGPMLTDTYPPGAHALTRAREYITQAVSRVRAAGDARVSFLEFATQDFANGIGCDYHPSLRTQRLMGEQLAAALRSQMRW